MPKGVREMKYISAAIILLVKKGILTIEEIEAMERKHWGKRIEDAMPDELYGDTEELEE